MKETKAGSAVAGREGRIGSVAGEALTSIRSWPKRTKTFLGDVRSETRRVTWPSAKQIQATTIVVIVTVFFFGVYFGLLDWIYSRVVGWLLRWGG